MQVGKELGGGHQGAVYELLDGKGKDSGQVLKVSTSSVQNVVMHRCTRKVYSVRCIDLS